MENHTSHAHTHDDPHHNDHDHSHPHHDHAHGHGHGHHHHGDLTGSKLLWTVILNVIITVSQIIGGLISGSLALLSDALHNFSDVVALVIAYVANRLVKQPSTQEKTFGYKRAEMFAALFNASVLIGVGLLLFIEAIERLMNPEPIAGGWVIALALLSVVLNWVSVMLIAKDSEHNSNIRAAYLHLLTDTLTSVGVLISGVLVLWFNIYWVDAVMTILIALYLMTSAWGLLKHTTGVLLLFAPSHIDLDALVKEIESEVSIDNVHHLHLWQLDDHRVHLEAHLDFKEDVSLSEATQVIQRIESRLAEVFSITHCNFQAEFNRDDDKRLIGQC